MDSKGALARLEHLCKQDQTSPNETKRAARRAAAAARLETAKETGRPWKRDKGVQTEMTAFAVQKMNT